MKHFDAKNEQVTAKMQRFPKAHIEAYKPF